MHDVRSQTIVASRRIEDSLVEARRAHLLRESHADGPDFVEIGRPDAGPSLVDRLATAWQRITIPPLGRPAFR
jgi:hypothetical protein